MTLRLPRWCLGYNQTMGLPVPMVSRWLWPGNRTYLEVASMVVTWWIVTFVQSVCTHNMLLKYCIESHRWKLINKLGTFIWASFQWNVVCTCLHHVSWHALNTTDDFRLLDDILKSDIGHEVWMKQGCHNTAVHKKQTSLQAYTVLIMQIPVLQYSNASSTWKQIHLYIVTCIVLYFFVQIRLRTDVLRIPSSIERGFELMTSKSWRCISCHWDSCSNHSAISDFFFRLDCA